MSSFTDSRERTKKKRSLPKKASSAHAIGKAEGSFESFIVQECENGFFTQKYFFSTGNLLNGFICQSKNLVGKASSVACINPLMLPVSSSFILEHRNSIAKYEGIM